MRVLLASLLFAAVGCTMPVAEDATPSEAQAGDALGTEPLGTLFVEDGTLRYAPSQTDALSIARLNVFATTAGNAKIGGTVDRSLATSDVAALDAADYPVSVEVVLFLDQSDSQLVGAQLATGAHYTFTISTPDAFTADAPKAIGLPFSAWPLVFRGTVDIGLVHPDDYETPLASGWRVDGKKTVLSTYFDVPAVRNGQSVIVSFVVGAGAKRLTGKLLTKIGEAQSKIVPYTIETPGVWVVGDGSLTKPTPAS